MSRTTSAPIVPFGIDVDGMTRGDGRAVRQRHGLGDGPVIVYAGVMDEFQRLDLLLEALAVVAKQEPRAKLLVVQTIHQAGHLANLRRRIKQQALTCPTRPTTRTPRRMRRWSRSG